MSFSPFVRFLSCCSLLFLPVIASAQPVEIRGIVNDYVVVTSIDYCTNSLAVENAFLFKPGDRAMLIQVIGAVVDTAEREDAGGIVDLKNTGRWELVTVAAVSGDDLTIGNRLLNDYDSIGVQLVRMPSLKDAVVIAPLVAHPWDGRIGGVVAIEVAGELTLNADVDAFSAGFAGGEPSENIGAPPSEHLWQDPYSGRGGIKGGGIANLEFVKSAGRGPRGNGGGGGNSLNAGGGGGGNAGMGGRGASGGDWNLGLDSYGLPGAGLADGIAEGRIFMGGGGGGGQQNNHRATAGGDGGGIVLLKAGRIRSEFRTVSAVGRGASRSGVDGAGGGGAGGTIVIDTKEIVGSLYLSARGGAGGDNDSDGDTWAIHPPGGGGGGGAVILSLAEIPERVSVELGGGGAGRILNEHENDLGAYPLEGGRGMLLFSRPVVESTIPFRPVMADCGPDLTLCLGSGTPIGAPANPPGVPVSYRWSPSEGLSSDTVAVPVASPSRSTLYTMRAWDRHGCESVDTMMLTVAPPTAHLRGDSSGVVRFAPRLRFTDTCRAVPIENEGPDSLILEAPVLFGNQAFSIPPHQFPIRIPPGGRATMEICYAPSEMVEYRDTALLRIGCLGSFLLIAAAHDGRASGEICGSDLGFRPVEGTRDLLDVRMPQPNPGSGKIALGYTHIARDANDPPPRCHLYSTLGAVIAEARPSTLEQVAVETGSATTGAFELDLHDLPPGRYMIVVRAGEEAVMRSIVVVR